MHTRRFRSALAWVFSTAVLVSAGIASAQGEVPREPYYRASVPDTKDPAEYCDPSSRTHSHQGEPVHVVGEDPRLRAPTLRSRTRPEYTDGARRFRIAGLVVVEVVIGTDGRVLETHVCHELPLGLTEAAVETVRQWEFTVSRINDQPVRVSHVVAVEFRLPAEQVFQGRELEVGFNLARGLEADAVVAAGTVLVDHLGPALGDEVRATTVFFRPDEGVYFNGIALSDDALDRFVARLAGDSTLGQPTVAWTKRAVDGSVKFRLDVAFRSGD